MRRFQFSLRALLGATVFVAVACSTLLYASDTIASVVFTVTAVVLLAAVLAALFRRGTSRAFWVGFAIFGWGYLWLAHWPEPGWAGLPATSRPGWHLQEHEGLATTNLLSFTYHALLPLVRTPPPPSGVWAPRPLYSAPAGSYPPSTAIGPGGSAAPLPPVAPAVPVMPAPTPFSYPSLSSFMRVGHSLWAWLFAIFGGLLAPYLSATREKKP